MAAATLCLLAIFASSAQAAQPDTSPIQHGATIKVKRCAIEFTAAQTRPFTAKVWRLIRWTRGQPKPTTIRIYRQRLICAAGPHHRAAIRARWRASKRAFYRHRAEKRAERLHVTRDWCSPDPHPEGEGCWEIPAWCVRAESGESWTAHNPTSPARGPYQLLSHGEPWPVTDWREAMEHHRIAERLYAEGGLGPWVAC